MSQQGPPLPLPPKIANGLTNHRRHPALQNRLRRDSQRTRPCIAILLIGSPAKLLPPRFSPSSINSAWRPGASATGLARPAFRPAPSTRSRPPMLFRNGPGAHPSKSLTTSRKTANALHRPILLHQPSASPPMNLPPAASSPEKTEVGFDSKNKTRGLHLFHRRLGILMLQTLFLKGTGNNGTKSSLCF